MGWRNGTGENAKQRAEEAAEEASPLVDRIARFGYVTKGAVYVVVGGMALAAAVGMRGRTTDPPGALQAIGTQPFGRIALAFVALGLAGYALWRLVQAVAGPEGEGCDAAAASGMGRPRWATRSSRSPVGGWPLPPAGAALQRTGRRGCSRYPSAGPW